MKYLTKEWYELCQRTHLHFGMRVHSGAQQMDEELYHRLYKRKEKEHVKFQRDVYNVDPRFMLEQDGAVLVRAEEFISGDDVSEEDTMVYHMPAEEREHIEKLIADYDARPPFDELGSKQEFKSNLEWNCENKIAQLPKEIYDQIADIRVFSLGYCTKEVMQQLKKQSKLNDAQMQLISKEYREAQLAEPIPEHIRNQVHFHDCTVTELVSDSDLVIRFDTRGGFTNLNKITFIAPEIIKQEGDIVGMYWLYHELYCIENGYEIHMLFDGEEMSELIIQCQDIVVEEE
ncbi:DUF4085 family protein [Paenibacillus illinoisensis]|uniref:DUF4085 family protein n=1 Tax=Paenibacillus illinoisensis TaxID=59845 RepID=UPI000FDB3ADC|nr:DUF4085 family protein [Paenibacillus illinoisensis]